MTMSNISYVPAMDNNASQIAEEVLSYKALPKNIINQDLLDHIQQSKAGTFVDESTYWDVYYEDKDYRYEWNNGLLEIKDMPTLDIIHSVRWLYKIMEQFLEVHPIAHLIILDFGFRISLPQKTAVRKPDCAIILNDNPVQPANKDRSFDGIYDICIEYLSDSNPHYVIKDTVERKHEYCLAMVKEYYIIDDMNKHTVFYRLDTNGNYVKIAPQKGVIRSTVLPGFQFRVSDLYDQPDLNRLIDDPVYQPYVRLDLQKERQEKEKERQAKEKERQEKEKERQAKEKEQQAKETALKLAEKERAEKQAAIEEIKRLKQLLKIQQKDTT